MNKFGKLKLGTEWLNILSNPAISYSAKIHHEQSIRSGKTYQSMFVLLNCVPEFRKLDKNIKYKIIKYFLQSYKNGYLIFYQLINDGSFKSLEEIRNIYSRKKDRVRKKYVNMRNTKRRFNVRKQN